MDLLLPFAKRINSGLLTFVDEVPSGLACNCLCIYCDMPVVASHYADRRSHFKHAPRVTSNETPCVANIQRAVFWLCRSILESANEIELPKYTTSYIQKDSKKSIECLVTECQLYSYKDVVFRPAFESENIELATIKTEKMSIDLALSYKQLEAERYFSNTKNDVARVEICINSLAQYINNIDTNFREHVKRKLLYGTNLRTWHYHPDETRVIREQIQKDKFKEKESFNQRFPIELITPVQSDAYDRIFSEFEQSEKPYIIEKKTKEYENRRFRCLKCNHLWTNSVENVAYSQSNIECPNCFSLVYIK